MYLEPIFSSPDIMAQMPEEGRRFFIVDNNWRNILKQVKQDPSVLSVIGIEKILDKFQKSSDLLDLIQKVNQKTFSEFKFQIDFNLLRNRRNIQ